jgi:hypothetical protein
MTSRRYPNLRLRLCDSRIIHTQKYYRSRTGMFTAKQQRPTQEYPWQTFPRFYRPWRLAATSHRDLVPPPDIAQCHPPVVPPSHVSARFSTARTTERRLKSPVCHPTSLSVSSPLRVYSSCSCPEIDQSISVAYAHSCGYLQRPSSVPERPERNSLCPKKLFRLTRTSLILIEQCFCTSPPIRLSASSSL